jgi:hypothetical protein
MHEFLLLIVCIDALTRLFNRQQFSFFVFCFAKELAASTPSGHLLVCWNFT